MPQGSWYTSVFWLTRPRNDEVDCWLAASPLVQLLQQNPRYLPVTILLCPSVACQCVPPTLVLSVQKTESRVAKHV